MSLRLVTAPTAEPVSLAEAKAHLKVESSDDDSLISALITAARQHMDGRDGYLGMQLMTATWELVIDRFPIAEIELPLPPVQSVTSVKYVDTNGDEQTVSSDDYEVDTDSWGGGWVAPVQGVGWPSTMETMNAVTIRFVAGYADPAVSPADPGGNVPAPIKQAMLLLIAHWYGNRKAVAIERGLTAALEVPFAVDALLMPYRRWSFG